MANPPDVDVEIGRNPAETGSHVPRGSAGARSHLGGGNAPPVPPAIVPAGRQIVGATVGSRPELPQADRIGDAVDQVGRQVGRVVGYVRSRTRAEMRADAERAIVDSPVLALAAALGLGYVVGRQVRR